LDVEKRNSGVRYSSSMYVGFETEPERERPQMALMTGSTQVSKTRNGGGAILAAHKLGWIGENSVLASVIWESLGDAMSVERRGRKNSIVEAGTHRVGLGAGVLTKRGPRAGGEKESMFFCTVSRR